jgi:hypothetical protein
MYYDPSGYSKVNCLKDGFNRITDKGSGKRVTETSKLLDYRPELTGSNREKLLSTIQNKKLKNVANELYRPGSTTGDGGTASKLMDECISANSTHLTKAEQRLRQLNNIGKNELLSLNDWDILDVVRYDLEQAINLFK